ncbi:SacI homology domain-containing protein [Coniochaeta sp. 2T2.1]|nr:SacI homology domain-containing protein [Coniochaeta sp. 2T2.1]
MDHTSSSALWSGQTPSSEKSSQILVRDYPHRAIAIVSSGHALILRYSQTTGEAIANGSLSSVPSGRARSNSASNDGLNSKCIVEFSPVSKQMLADYRPLTSRSIYGTLGFIALGRDVFICVITHASRVATLRPGETVERILSVQFFCLNSSEYDDVVSLDTYDVSSDTVSTYGQSLSRRETPIEHPCEELQKLLSNGSFYYSTDFDVTNILQDRSADAANFDIDNFDEAYLWNSYMIQPLVQFRSRLQDHERDILDASRILTSAIRGFCLTIAIPQSSAPLRSTKSGLPSYLTVISRLSCRRAGTRFNSRGIDDDGNVANFVETETVYWSPSGITFSYAQVRGSVPVFWEQTAGLIPGQQKITVTRSPDGTQPAFNKHFQDLEEAYGAVHVVNLLSASKPGEAELSGLYRNAIRHCPLSRPQEKQSQDHVLLRSTEYDFHAETKGPTGYEAAREIRRHIEDSADGFAYYLAEDTDDLEEDANGVTHHNRRPVVVLQQEGVFRTNCLDCLDRTNLIQTMISQMAVEAFLGHRGEYATADFWMRHSSLWADNGDALSRIYAGTGALKSSFTRHGKMSLAGAFADARKSATRLYINNFADKGRQNTIDMLLGRLVGQAPVILYDPISDYVNGELQKRASEYSSVEKIHIWVGTFNLNGRTNGIDEDLSAWLCPPEIGNKQPEIVAVGFQEIVELSPQQIMNSDPTRKQLWEKAVKRTLDNHARQIGGEKYVLLRSGQLVGAALCIFVRSSVLQHIKNVEGSVKKTGMSGMAGNKGAVAIRFDYANTPICFVTAHLAAGFANYDERNKDYATIYHGLRFQRNRRIDDHDSVIWFGDFNYRIGLSHDRAHELVRTKDLGRLYENDQLNLQMVAGLAFRYYSEARITFMPTYKYDIGTDQYDTSEKARIPAWTDRILRKGTNLRQLSYNSAPLKFSDHRPVYAMFECTANIVNEPLRDKISREIYVRRKAEVGEGTANATTEETDDEDLMGYDAIEPGLPPASSDRQKWWLENGKMARSTMTAPKPIDASQETILNPKRPHNPFAPTEEPDWVSIPSRSRLSSFSSMSTSPYEHINHSTILSTSASSSGQRKLPPPYDPSALPAKVGRLNLDGQKNHSGREETPPPPPPRRQNGTPKQSVPRTQTMPVGSEMERPLQKAVPKPDLPARRMSSASQHSVKNKVPPPVAKKPTHLTAASPTIGSPNGPSAETHSSPNGDDQVKPSLPRRSSTAVNNQFPSNQGKNTSYDGPARDSGSTRNSSSSALNREVHDRPPQLPKRAGTGLTTSGRQSPAGAISLPGMSPSTREPVVGAKPSVPSSNTQGLGADLLGDDGGMEMSGWEALKPS